MNAIFGDWDGAPITEDCPTVPVPVGDRCGMCNTAFEPGDVGLRMGHIGVDPESATAMNVHRECLFLNTCGHSVGVCTCTGYDTTTRETALEAWARRGEPQ